MQNKLELKAFKSLYSSFPVKENLVTEGNFYDVIEQDSESFTIFDDTNHSRTFFKVELNELFVDFTADLLGFVRFLEASTKLNKGMPLGVYDYQIKKYKSFTMEYMDNSQRPSGKQFISLVIKGSKYYASDSCGDVLRTLKARFGLLDELKEKYDKC